MGRRIDRIENIQFFNSSKSHVYLVLFTAHYLFAYWRVLILREGIEEGQLIGFTLNSINII